MSEIEKNSIYTEKVEELVAIAAAIASNCENCFKFHYNKALKLGVSKDDMLLAVETANAVKNNPAKTILTLARKILNGSSNLDAQTSHCSCSKENSDKE
jgi:AhpD family alkylhydroperoxidase